MAQLLLLGISPRINVDPPRIAVLAPYNFFWATASPELGFSTESAGRRLFFGATCVLCRSSTALRIKRSLT
jgi:hypothetical protein